MRNENGNLICDHCKKQIDYGKYYARYRVNDDWSEFKDFHLECFRFFTLREDIPKEVVYQKLSTVERLDKDGIE